MNKQKLTLLKLLVVYISVIALARVGPLSTRTNLLPIRKNAYSSTPTISFLDGLQFRDAGIILQQSTESVLFRNKVNSMPINFQTPLVFKVLNPGPISLILTLDFTIDGASMTPQLLELNEELDEDRDISILSKPVSSNSWTIWVDACQTQIFKLITTNTDLSQIIIESVGLSWNSSD